MTEKVSENSVIYHNVRATLKALTIENVRLFKTLPQNYLIIIRTYYMTRPGTKSYSILTTVQTEIFHGTY